MPGGSKPGERRGGRQNGTPNKTTHTLKQTILGALEAELQVTADRSARPRQIGCRHAAFAPAIVAA